MTSRIDLRLTEELATMIARAAASVGLTDRSWSRRELLVAARHKRVRIGDVPPGGEVRLGIPLESTHRAEIDAAVERSGLSLSDWVRAMLAQAAEAEIRAFSAGREKSTGRGKKG